MPQSSSQVREYQVRDIMTTPVCCIGMNGSIRDAKALFETRNIHHVVVVERKRVVGVVSDRDILKVISPFIGNVSMQRSQDLGTMNKRIHQIMTRSLVSIGPDETTAQAAKKMLEERVSCLPVVDHDLAPLGIVTIRDFLASVAGIAKY